MAKNNNKDSNIYPEDKDWVNYTCNINDGWADDVPIQYNEKTWKPSEDELTIIDIDDTRNMALLSDDVIDEYNRTHNTMATDADIVRASRPSRKKQANDNEYREDTVSEEKYTEDEYEDTPSKKKFFGRVHFFRLFIIVWCGVLAICAAIFLGFFYNFLDNYQKAYEESLPYHTMDNIMDHFRVNDMDTIYNFITAKPELSAFETPEILEEYMSMLTQDKVLKYVEASPFNADFPHYYIMADDYIIADVNLRKSQTDTYKYNFPIWYISSFEFYTDAQHNFKLEAPSTYSISVNGIPLTADNITKNNITLDAQEYFKDYTTLPKVVQYSGEGLYMRPEITAYDSLGNEAEVTFDDNKGVYTVALGSTIEGEDEIKELAIRFISDYANYISGDVSDHALDSYFLPESDMLSLINAGTYREFFNSHVGTEISNEEVTEFIVYNENAVFVRVNLDQNILFNHSGEGSVQHLNLGVYMLKTDSGWKVCTMQY